MTYPDQQIIAMSKKRIVIGIIGSILMAGLAVWGYTNGDSDFVKYGISLSANQEIMLESFVFVMSIILLIYYVKKFSSADVGIIVDQIGLTDKAGMLSPSEVILWSDIKNIDQISIGKKKIIRVLDHDPEKRILRFSPFQSILHKLTMRGDYIYIVPDLLVGKNHEVFAVIQNYWNSSSNKSKADEDGTKKRDISGLRI